MTQDEFEDLTQRLTNGDPSAVEEAEAKRLEMDRALGERFDFNLKELAEQYRQASNEQLAETLAGVMVGFEAADHALPNTQAVFLQLLREVRKRLLR